MKKTHKMKKRAGALLMALLLLMGNMPAKAADFSDGMQTELGDGGGQEEDVFSAPEEEFSSEESFQEESFQDELLPEESRQEGQVFGDEPDYIMGRPLTQEELQEQMAPFENLSSLGEVPDIQSEPSVSLFAEGSYASRYDARDYGYVSPVKNQNPTGLCWGFSMASLLETSLLVQGYGLYDLSEEHLAYFFSNRQNDPLGNTAGDFNAHIKEDYHNGGNVLCTSLFLSSWSGMTTEENVPFDPGSKNPPDAGKAYDTTAYLKNAVFSTYSEARMKQLISQYQAVSVMYNMNNGYYNADTAAYSYPIVDDAVTHIVTVVGWDDTYRKENFKESSNVTGDGAWIVKNSWGSEWGKEGYFYISYEDKSLSALVSAQASLTPAYYNNYFYDGTAGGATINVKDGDSVACVFDAKAGEGNLEALGEVVLASFTDNSTFQIQVYTELTDDKNPLSGIPAFGTPVEVMQSVQGISTVSVPEVLLRPGTKYSVVITNVSGNSVQYCCELNTSYSWVNFIADVAEKQGFFSQNGYWYDGCTAVSGKPFTPRIKAHTKNLDVQASMTLSENAVVMKPGETKAVTCRIQPAAWQGSVLSWESSNETVAVADQYGKITAKAPGTAVITCRAPSFTGLTASCTVRVEMDSIKSFTAAPKTYDQILLSWSQVKGADGYILFRKESGQNEVQAAKLSSGTLSYTDKGLKTGTTYYYRVRAYAVSDGTNIWGDYISYKAARTTLGSVKANVKVSGNLYNTVSWNKAAGANGYYVYRRQPGKSWSCIKTIANGNISSWQDKNIKALTSYIYAVRAYRTVNGKNILGAYTQSSTVISAPNLQKLDTLTVKSNGIRLTWKAQKKADGYRIYSKTGNGSWKVIKTVTNSTQTSYRDKNVKKGKTYTYCIRAYVKEPYGSIVYSKYKSAKKTYK